MEVKATLDSTSDPYNQAKIKLSQIKNPCPNIVGLMGPLQKQMNDFSEQLEEQEVRVLFLCLATIAELSAFSISIVLCPGRDQNQFLHLSTSANKNQLEFQDKSMLLNLFQSIHS